MSLEKPQLLIYGILKRFSIDSDAIATQFEYLLSLFLRGNGSL
ncbi:MAG: hypothetical protein ACOC0N_12870 [Chroococcales cyanobacterium]